MTNINGAAIGGMTAAMSSAANSDTMSEVSDSGTGTSGRSYSDSREEMHQLAVSLGLESAEDLAKERFKVDRKKLEAMLHCEWKIFFVFSQSDRDFSDRLLARKIPTESLCISCGFMYVMTIDTVFLVDAFHFRVPLTYL